MRWFLFSVIITISCTKRQLDEVDNSIVETIIINPENSESSLLSQSYQSIEYVFLDFPDSIPMVRFYKILIENGKIFIEDRDFNSILIFNKNGTFYNIIRSTGMGPGEFYQTEDFQIISNNVIIKDSYLGKEIEFDVDGNFISEYKPEVPEGNFYKKDSFSLFYSQNFTDLGSYEFVLKDQNGLSGLVPFQREYEQVNASTPFGFIFDKYRNEIIFNKPFTPDVYLFDSVGNLSHQLKFDFGHANLDERSRVSLDPSSRQEKVRNENLVEYINSFIPLKNGYFVDFLRGYRSKHEVFLSKDFKIQKQIKSYKNDIDGMRIRNVPWYYDDNMIGYIIPSYLFYQDYQDTFLENEADTASSEIHGFIRKYDKRLEEDSYVLVFFHVRDDPM